MHLSGLSGHEDFICFNILILATFANLHQLRNIIRSICTRAVQENSYLSFLPHSYQRSFLTISEIGFLCCEYMLMQKKCILVFLPTLRAISFLRLTKQFR